MKKHNFFILSFILTFFLVNPCLAEEEQDEISIDKTSLQELEDKNDLNKKIDEAFNEDDGDNKKEIEDEIQKETKEDAKEKIGDEVLAEVKEVEKEVKEDGGKEEVIVEEKIEILKEKDGKDNKEKIKEEDKKVEEKQKEVKEEKEEDKEGEVNKEEINLDDLTSSDIKKLGHELRTGTKEEKEKAISILTKLGKKAAPATNDIIASIHEKKTKEEAVDILYNIGTAPAIAGLARLVSNDNKALGEYILRKIAGFKEDAQFVVDDIFANYSNKDLKEEVIFALGEIKGERSYYELREILKGTDSDRIKILALNQLMKFDDVKKDLPLFRRIFRKSAPSDFTLQLSNAIIKLEGN